jgi:hypothetical protein
VTFTEFLRIKKGIDSDGKDISEFTAVYYDEYVEYLKGLKDGCGDEAADG